MTLTPEDVRNKQFSTVRLREGYEMDEVDAFLDEVEAELTRLLRDNDDLRTRLTVTSRQPAPAAPEPAPAPAAPPPPPPPPPVAAVAAVPVTDNAVRMLELAQRTADEHVLQAKNEAERILAEARVGAAKLTSDAQREHVILQARVEELKAFEREYRTRLRSYLEGQLHDLDQMSGEPAGPGGPGSQTSPSTNAAGNHAQHNQQQAPPPPPPPAPAQVPQAPAPQVQQQPPPVPAGAPTSQPPVGARPSNPFGPPPVAPSAPGQPPSGPPAQP
jgi:DivIVA domain-containing protein